MTAPNSGQFQKGQSGNPGGRPRLNDDLKVKCREMTEQALETLRAAMTEGDSTASRVRAAELVLAYGWGRPTETTVVEHAEASVASVLDPDELAARAKLFLAARAELAKPSRP